MSESAATPSKQGFFIRRSNIKGRLDAEFNYARLTIRITSQYPQTALRKISRSRTGGTPNKAIADYWNGDIPWASPKDFGHFYLEDTEDHITPAAVIDSSTAVVPKGSVLLVFRSGILQHTMPVAVAKCEMAINQDVKAFTFDRSIMSEYAAAYFTIFGSRLLPLITKSGATVQSINTEQFEQLTIPIPPLNVQTQIVDDLLKAFQAKRAKELEAISLLRTIDDVLLDELGIKLQPEPPNTIESRIFYRRLSEVSGERLDPIANQDKRMRFVEAIYSSDFPVQLLRQIVNFSKRLVNSISPAEIYIGLENIDSETGEFIATAEKESISAAIQFEPGQILFPKLRPYLNKTHLPTFNGLCSTEFHVFTPLSIRAEYLTWFLRSRAIVGITSLLMTGNTLPRLQMADIERLPIPIPPLPVQEKLSAEIARLKNEAATLRAKATEELAEAKQSIESLILGEGGES